MIIFDFDLTLVDTQPVQALRSARNWSAVMARLKDLNVYDGITEMLNELRTRNQTLAVVTKSPSMVPKAFIGQNSWPVDIVIGYHDVKRQKPDPESLLLAMKKANATAGSTFHVGDSPEDTQASRAAGVTAIGAGWGIANVEPLETSAPDYLFRTVFELTEFFVGIA